MNGATRSLDVDAALTPYELLLVDAIAARVADRLFTAATREGHLLDTAGVAQRFGVTAEWVRLNADRLGGVRLGSGPRSPYRFDPEKVADALSARQVSRGSEVAKPPPRRRSRPRTSSGAPLLPIRAPKQRPKRGAGQV